MREFTIEDAINIQTEQLALWEKHLVASTFNAIKARTIRDNDKARSVSDIKRGSDIDNFIGNFMLGNKI